MTFGLVLAWYDFWIGFYWDRKARALYFLPIPFIGIVIRFRPRVLVGEFGEFRGHPMRFDGKRWVYWDTGEEPNEERPCGKCGRKAGPDGHDPCIARLPLAMNACCGHGDSSPYIQFTNGETVTGEAARSLFPVLLQAREFLIIDDPPSEVEERSPEAHDAVLRWAEQNGFIK